MSIAMSNDSHPEKHRLRALGLVVILLIRLPRALSVEQAQIAVAVAEVQPGRDDARCVLRGW
jgi:hypothetical protein